MRLTLVLLSALLASGCGPAAEQPSAQSVAAIDSGLTIELPPEPTAELAVPPVEEAKAPAAEETAPPPPETKEPEPKPAQEAEEPAPPREKAATAEQVRPAPPEDRSAASTEARLAGPRPPLSNAEIARTIRRIGYSCDEVVAAGRVQDSDASEPVFRINCSSGSFRGTTRNGRLFFRPWEAGSSSR